MPARGNADGEAASHRDDLLRLMLASARLQQKNTRSFALVLVSRAAFVLAALKMVQPVSPTVLAGPDGEPPTPLGG